MRRRTTWATIVLAGLLLLAIAAQDQTPSERGGRAGLVVRYDDQRVESRCVALDAAEISGYDLLQDSGLALDVKSAGQGGLVCAIEGTGCGPDNCLCQCQGEPCIYWSYWRLGDEGWAYSAVGATVRRVSDGQVDGWSWGPGSVTSAIEPPETTFEEICSNDAQLFSSPAAATRQTGPASWLPYVVLGLLLAIIGGGAWLASKRRADS